MFDLLVEMVGYCCSAVSSFFHSFPSQGDVTGLIFLFFFWGGHDFTIQDTHAHDTNLSTWSKLLAHAKNKFEISSMDNTFAIYALFSSVLIFLSRYTYCSSFFLCVNFATVISGILYNFFPLALYILLYISIDIQYVLYTVGINIHKTYKNLECMFIRFLLCSSTFGRRVFTSLLCHGHFMQRAGIKFRHLHFPNFSVLEARQVSGLYASVNLFLI